MSLYTHRIPSLYIVPWHLSRGGHDTAILDTGTDHIAIRHRDHVGQASRLSHRKPGTFLMNNS